MNTQQLEYVIAISEEKSFRGSAPIRSRLFAMQ